MLAAQVLMGARLMPKEKFDKGRDTDRWSREVYRIIDLQHRIIEAGSPSARPVGEVTGRIEVATACCFESKAQAAVSVPSSADAPLVYDFKLRFEAGEGGWHMVSGTVSHRRADGGVMATRELLGRAIDRAQLPTNGGPVGLLAAHIEKRAAR